MPLHIPFNGLQYANTLKNAGIEAPIAEAHARAQANVRQAGIIEREAPLRASKVMLICTKCNRPTRVGFRFLEGGNKVRVCSYCHEVID